MKQIEIKIPKKIKTNQTDLIATTQSKLHTGKAKRVRNDMIFKVSKQ